MHGVGHSFKIPRVRTELFETIQKFIGNEFKKQPQMSERGIEHQFTEKK